MVHMTKTKDKIIFIKTIAYAPKDVIQRQRKSKFFRMLVVLSSFLISMASQGVGSMMCTIILLLARSSS